MTVWIVATRANDVRPVQMLKSPLQTTTLGSAEHLLPREKEETDEREATERPVLGSRPNMIAHERR